MANYTAAITAEGLDLINQAATGNARIEWLSVKAGDGELGGTDPAILLELISIKQTFVACDVRKDANQVPYLFFVTSNEGLAAGYLRREIGIFGRLQGSTNDIMVVYLYAPTDADADFIPATGGGVATTQSFRVQLAQAADLDASVTIDQSIVYLPLDRWADHLSGAGGPDQHSVATTLAAGMMSAADKTKIDEHINTAAPSNGTSVHAVATQAAAGFISAADKTKLDGIEAGAEINQNAFANVKVGSTTIQADSKSDVLELHGSFNIVLTPDAANDKVTFTAVNITPSSHIGSNGNVHGVATQAVAGFSSAADKTKLDGIQDGAEVNQNAFAGVQVGSTTIQADGKSDVLELAGASYVNVTADAASDKATFSFGMPYYLIRTNVASPIGVNSFRNHANTRLCGMVLAPGGGLYLPALNVAAAAITCFEMRINNVSGASVIRTIPIACIDDDLHYQIDQGAITQLLTGVHTNTSVTITIPTGVHTLTWYVVSQVSVLQLAMTDWLDANIRWEPGHYYY